MAQAIPLVFSMAGAKIAGMAFAGSELAVGIGWMAGGMLGSMLFPQKSSSHNMPQMAEYPVQSSSRGLPVPLVYGTRKVAGNIIWLGDLQSYVVVHKQSGGKAGGGSGGSTTETRYRRSFLIAICEGPANVTRIWEGKKEVSLEIASYFDGLNNTGISTVVGEDYGEYKHVLCAYFDSIELGNSQQIPNFTFEIRAGGVGIAIASDHLTDWAVVKLKPDGDLNSQFGINYTHSENSGVSAVYYSNIDGSVYFSRGYDDFSAEGYFYFEFDTGVGGIVIGDTLIGNLNGSEIYVEDIEYFTATTGYIAFRYITGNLFSNGETFTGVGISARALGLAAHSGRKWIHKFDKDGKLVKTWGQNGRKVVNGGTIIKSLYEDSEGNLYYGSNTRHGKLDADGQWAWSVQWFAGTELYVRVVWSITLSQDEQHVYMAGIVTNLGGGLAANTSYTIMKLSTATGALDVTWGENNDGRYTESDWWVAGQNRDIYTVKRIPNSEELFIHHWGARIADTRYSLTKITAGGVRDTSFGTNGHTNNLETPVSPQWGYGCSMAVNDSRNIWTAGNPITLDGVFDQTVCNVTCLNRSAIELYRWSVSEAGIDVVKSINVWGGYVFLGGDQRTEDGVDAPLHRYTYDGTHDPNYPGDVLRFGGALYIGEISWIFRSISGQSDDVNPAWVIYDILTNTRYGAGIPTAEINIASFEEVADFCDNNEYGFSFLLNRTRPVKDWIDHINSHFFGFLTQTEGFYSLGVFRDEDSVGTLTRDNFLIDETEEPEPPINISKRDPKDTANRIEIGWTNREKLYNVNFAVANDHVEQRITGQTRKRVLGLDGITKESLATRLAWRYLYDSLYRFSDYTFQLGYQDRFLAPGQVVTLDDGDIVNNKKVRIVSIEEDENGRNLTIEAREDEAYLYPDIDYQSATSKHSEAAAASLASPLLAFREDVADRLLYVSIVPQSEDTNGWYIYRSYDDVTYELAGTTGIDSVASANAHGTTDTTLPSHKAVVWKYDQTLRVTLDANLAIESGTELEFFNNKKLAKIGDEIIGYKTATLISGTTYELRELIRGLFNTEPVAHAIGEEFFTLDVDFNYAFTKEDIGRTIYFKMLTFAGDTIQQLADVTGIAYTIQGEYLRPAPVSLIRNVGREGFEDISGYPADVDFNFGNRLSGWNFGGWGDMPWGQFEKDLAIKQVGVRLLKTDGTEILSELYELFGYYADEYRITIEDADRDGNDPIDIEIAAIGNLVSAARSSRIDIA